MPPGEPEQIIPLVTGEVFLARADHNQDVRLPPGHWLRSARQSGGGALIGSGIHRIDLLRWFLGEVEAVTHVQVVRPERFEAEAACLTTLRFRNGAIAALATNWAARRSPWYELMWLNGSQGSMHNLGGLHLERAADPAEAPGFAQVQLPARDSFSEEIQHFVTCVREGRTPLTSGADALHTLEVVLAAYRSAAEAGRPVAP